ncbi:MAG: hypothetical protein M3409_09590 [Gemmatimonadota bacterium]|nr:hypothetical protein [Gemmatimonadota bacterium]
MPSRGNGPAAYHQSGLAPNLVGALAYVLGPLTGILFMVVEKSKNDSSASPPRRPSWSG